MPEDRTSMTLIQRASDGDQAAWQRIVTTYGPVVFRKCRRAGFAEADAEDLTQDVFVKLNRGLKSFHRDPPRQLFRKWLAVLVRNACTDAHRRIQAFPRVTTCNLDLQVFRLEQQCDSETAFTLNDIDMQVSMSEVMRRVESVTSPEHWQAFWGTQIKERTAREVGDELGFEAANVRKIRTRVYRAIVEEARLMGMLDDEREHEGQGSD